MCIRLGVWLTNKFQVTSLQVSLQTMIFTMNKNKKSFHGASVPVLILSLMLLLLGMTF